MVYKKNYKRLIVPLLVISLLLVNSTSITAMAQEDRTPGEQPQISSSGRYTITVPEETADYVCLSREPAAGNDNTLDADFPARYPEVISVGSVDYDGSFSDNNTYGTNIEILAPGENIFAQSMLGLYTRVAGTSIAAPHVTGIAGLLWQKDRSRSADFIRGLMDTSSNTEVANNSEAGAGIVDLESAYFR